MKSFIAIPRDILKECVQGSDLERIKQKVWHKAYEQRRDYIICEIVNAVDVRPKIEITPWEE